SRAPSTSTTVAMRGGLGLPAKLSKVKDLTAPILSERRTRSKSSRAKQRKQTRWRGYCTQPQRRQRRPARVTSSSRSGKCLVDEVQDPARRSVVVAGLWGRR